MASVTFSGLDPFRLNGITLTKNELGTGSYATVFQLDYYGLKCAGKKIHDLLIKQQAGRGDTYQLTRFAEECRLLSQIRHPNVVQFLGVYYEQGMKVPILVMEFLPIDLTSCIEKNGVLRPELSYSILHDVALGLNYLHSQEPPIIHRDLSSNNVLLTSAMKAKISDLGVAKIVNLTPMQVSRMVHNTRAPGTPAYMPPEALAANPKYDRSIDVFSFGIMIIHMFSGKWPEPQIGQIRLEQKSDRMIPVSEAERRQVFLQAIGDKHPMMSLIRQCIANNSKKRPNVNQIVPQLKVMVARNSPSFFNRLEMLQHIDKRKSNEEKLQSQNKALRQELKAATAKKQDVRFEQGMENVKTTDSVHKKMDDHEEHYLLMRDTPGEKAPGTFKKILGMTNPKRVLRGELLRPIPREKDPRSDVVQPNYSVERDPAITLFAVDDDIAPLNIDDYYLLKAIESPSDRWKVFSDPSDPQWLDWGASLKVGSLVYVHLPTPSTSVPTWSHAIVRYKGPVKTLFGMNFGVEIMDPDNRGKGTSDGIFQNHFYFTCNNNCGLFVSLEKLWFEPAPQYMDQPSGSHHQQKFATVTVPPGSSSTVNINPNLTVNSRIQMPTASPTEPFKYGVIRWIGEIPAIQGLVAGIEMDDYMEGCTDGTFTSTGQKFFDCMQGRGIYYPLVNLQPDMRFMDPASVVGGDNLENPLDDVPYNVEEDQFTEGRSEQIQRYIGDRKGIQGHQNSCYLDSSIFGLFALTDAFDELFLKAESSKTADQNRQAIADLLWKGIVNPLRKYGVARYESVMALRTKLDELGKMEGIAHAEKDPEEFLNMLFKHTLKVDPFLIIRRPYGNEPEFFVQLFVEYKESDRLPSVGLLLHTMFKEQKLSFLQMPSRLLIQVPRFGRQFKTYDKIIPDLKLSVAYLTDEYIQAIPKCLVCNASAELACKQCAVLSQGGYFCPVCSGQFHAHPNRKDHVLDQNIGSGMEESPLDLLSVICIETSHYVCFSKEPSEDPNKPHKWIFFDSMASRVYDRFNIPSVTECSDLLNQWVYPANGDLSRLRNTAPRDLPEYVRRFTQDVYLCVYVNTDAILYGY